MIQKINDSGVVLKVDGIASISPNVFTGSRWDRTTIDQKNAVLQAVGSVAAYFNPGPEGTTPNVRITVKHGGTGAPVGNWDTIRGFRPE